MPPAHLPPTPASSTDIRGKEKLLSLAPALALPPAAYTEHDDCAASTTPSSNGSDSSYHPASPIHAPKTAGRKQAAAIQSRSTKVDNAFALPPPPTRSRKIIQVKPKGSPEEEKSQADAVDAGASSGKGGKKRGNNGSTTAQGRKIARKTAHSLIERRRRSKMNEEFGVLKDMIPACKGQEMHKLAILQASIDYLRYLERCIVDLKAANEAPSQTTSPTQQPANDNMQVVVEEEEATDAAPEAVNHDSDSDEAMSEDNDDDVPTPNTLSQSHSRTSLPSLASLPSMSHFSTTAAPTTSPALLPTAYHQQRHYSVSSTSQASFSPYMHSTQTSPFFGPSYGGQDPGAASFALTSPALKPLDHATARRGSTVQYPTLGVNDSGEAQQQERERRERDLDKEAMAALLMLNSDRRSWKDKSGRGMSVQDLLSH